MNDVYFQTRASCSCNLLKNTTSTAEMTSLKTVLNLEAGSKTKNHGFGLKDQAGPGLILDALASSHL